MSNLTPLTAGLAEPVIPNRQPNPPVPDTDGNAPGDASGAAHSAASMATAAPATANVMPNLLVRLQEFGTSTQEPAKPVPAAPQASGSQSAPPPTTLVLSSRDPAGDGIAEAADASSSPASRMQFLSSRLDPQADATLGTGQTPAESGENNPNAPMNDGGASAIAEAQAQALIQHLTSLNAQMLHLSAG